MATSRRDGLRNILSAVQRSATLLESFGTQRPRPTARATCTIPTLNLPYPDDLVVSIQVKQLPRRISDAIIQKIEASIVKIQALHTSNFEATIARLSREAPSTLTPTLLARLAAQYEHSYHDRQMCSLRAMLSQYLTQLPSECEIERRRPGFNVKYTPILEKYFQLNAYPSVGERRTLADRSGMTARQIEVWFQNHRNRSKKEGLSLPRQAPGRRSICLDTLERESSGSTSMDIKDCSSDDESVCDELPADMLPQPLDSPSPSHAFPAPYPPHCSYDPFPTQSNSLPTPQWFRRCSTKPTPTNMAEPINVDELASLFASKLTVRDTPSKAAKQKTSQSISPPWFCATVTIPSAAPHPAFVKSSSSLACSYSKPSRRYSPFPSCSITSCDRQSPKPRLPRRLPDWSKHSVSLSKPPSRTVSMESISSCQSSSSNSSIDELATPPLTPLQAPSLTFNDLFDNTMAFDFPNLSPSSMSFGLDTSNKTHPSLPPMFLPFQYATSS